ncbi:MAG: transporter ATP-binding protein [Hyphomicrobiales bacterium]|nr:transporter ATP-binding protein [Hyphomicrobiales bacterium]
MPKAKFSRVMRFVVHYWLLSPRLFFTLVAVRVLSTLVDVSIPLASGWLIDAIASGQPGDSGPAIRALVVFVALGALFQASRQIVTFLLNRLSARAITTIGRDAFAKVQRFSSDWHANSFAGATVRKITRGMTSFDTFTDTLAFGLLPAFIVVVGVTGVFAWRWPILGLVVGVSIVVFLIVTVLLAVLWIRPANVEAREWDSKMSGVIADSITGNPVVKSFAAEGREDQRFGDVAKGWEWRAIRSWDRSAVSGLIQAFLLVLLQIGMLGTGVWLWTQGRASPGDIASLIATQFLITGYLRDIAQHVRSVQRTINDMDDVLDFRDADLQVADVPGAKTLAVTRGTIAFEDVTFKYTGAREPLYEHFSLLIPAGQRVGLVGQSGAGKSSFVKLIQRLYDLDGGRILIDGHDISKVTQTSLREAVGLVPQDPVLFHRSIAENIAYGRPGATMDEIEEAARLSHVDEFVRDLPKGYETLVGERGVKLSGGERQRVAIARAILAATPILILDEATSSLDSVSEHYIRDAMDKLAAGRTTMVIAHRLSTVQKLDRILVFDRGRIVEDGTHAELMRREAGVYRRLVETQTGSFLVADAAE